MKKIIAVVRKRTNKDIQNLLVASNNVWIETDPMTYWAARKTLQQGGTFFSSDRLPR